jgi:hypothetical protein
MSAGQPTKTHNPKGGLLSQAEDEFRVVSWNVEHVRHEALHNRAGV